MVTCSLYDYMMSKLPVKSQTDNNLIIYPGTSLIISYQFTCTKYTSEKPSCIAGIMHLPPSLC